MMKKAIQQLVEQRTEWEPAKSNYEALAQVRVKQFDVNGSTFSVQFNPARMVSSSARLDTESIRERACFLCPCSLFPGQKGISFEGRYSILVNPFPIFPLHLTIPEVTHTGQRILTRLGDMLELAKELDEYVILYNGPKSGASAPDHMHFQAGSKGFLPIEKEWRGKVAGKITGYRNTTLWYLDDTIRPALVIEAGDGIDAVVLFNLVYNAMELKPGDDEAMMNLLVYYEADKWLICIFPREKHRPACFEAEGDKKMLISPGCADMGGVLITPREEDFNKITGDDISGIFKEVCISPEKFSELKKRIKAQL